MDAKFVVEMAMELVGDVLDGDEALGLIIRDEHDSQVRVFLKNQFGDEALSADPGYRDNLPEPPEELTYADQLEWKRQNFPHAYWDLWEMVGELSLPRVEDADLYDWEGVLESYSRRPGTDAAVARVKGALCMVREARREKEEAGE